MAAQQVSFVLAMMKCCIQNDEICMKNDELCQARVASMAGKVHTHTHSPPSGEPAEPEPEPEPAPEPEPKPVPVPVPPEPPHLDVERLREIVRGRSELERYGGCRVRAGGYREPAGRLCKGARGLPAAAAGRLREARGGDAPGSDTRRDSWYVNCVSKMMNSVFKMLNSVLKMMNFVSKMKRRAAPRLQASYRLAGIRTRAQYVATAVTETQ